MDTRSKIEKLLKDIDALAELASEIVDSSAMPDGQKGHEVGAVLSAASGIKGALERAEQAPGPPKTEGKKDPFQSLFSLLESFQSSGYADFLEIEGNQGKIDVTGYVGGKAVAQSFELLADLKKWLEIEAGFDSTSLNPLAALSALEDTDFRITLRKSGSQWVGL